MVFPLSGEARSTSAAGRGVVADAVRAVAPDLAQQVLDTRAWRTGYLPHFREMTRLALTAPGGATSIAAAGLASVHERFRYRHDGQDLPLSAVAELAADPGALGTHTVTGRGRPGPDVLSVPYRGGRLVADDLDAQLDAWLGRRHRRALVRGRRARGVARPAGSTCARWPSWCSARAREMGPLVSLLAGARTSSPSTSPGRAIWSRLLEVARGRRAAPLPVGALPAGAADARCPGGRRRPRARTPQRRGLARRHRGPGTLGNYVYADGPLNVRARWPSTR